MYTLCTTVGQPSIESSTLPNCPWSCADFTVFLFRATWQILNPLHAASQASEAMRGESSRHLEAVKYQGHCGSGHARAQRTDSRVDQK